MSIPNEIGLLLVDSEKAKYAATAHEKQNVLNKIFSNFRLMIDQVVEGPLRRWKICQIHTLGVERDQMALDEAMRQFKQLLKLWYNADQLAETLLYENWRITLHDMFHYLLKSCLVISRQPPLVMENNQEKKIVDHRVKATATAKFLLDVKSLLGERVVVVPSKDTAPNPSVQLVLKNEAPGGFIVDGQKCANRSARPGEKRSRRPANESQSSSTSSSSEPVDPFCLRLLNINVQRADRGTPKQPYHIRIEWTICLDSYQLPPIVVLSLPFLIRTGNSQDPELNQIMLTHYVLADDYSKNLELLEVKEGTKKSWDCWAQILSCFFYKMTEVRRLREDELKLIASKLGVTNFGNTYGNDFLKKSWPAIANKPQSEKTLFFEWFNSIITMLIDKNRDLVKYKSKRQETMLLLLSKNIIHPFMSWTHAKQLLQQYPHSGFIIRFSENKTAHMTISYKRDENRNGPQGIEPIHVSKLVTFTLPGYISTLVQLKDIQNILDYQGQAVSMTTKKLIHENTWSSTHATRDDRYKMAVLSLNENPNKLVTKINELSQEVQDRLEKYIDNKYLWDFLEYMEYKENCAKQSRQQMNKTAVGNGNPAGYPSTFDKYPPNSSSCVFSNQQTEAVMKVHHHQHVMTNGPDVQHITAQKSITSGQHGGVLATAPNLTHGRPSYGYSPSWGYQPTHQYHQQQHNVASAPAQPFNSLYQLPVSQQEVVTKTITVQNSPIHASSPGYDGQGMTEEAEMQENPNHNSLMDYGATAGAQGNGNNSGQVDKGASLHGNGDSDFADIQLEYDLLNEFGIDLRNLDLSAEFDTKTVVEQSSSIKL